MKKKVAALFCLLCLTGCVGKIDDMPADPVPVPDGPAVEAAGEVPEDEITCVAPVVPTDPATMSGAPDLSVFCAGEEVQAMNGGLNWVTTMPDGTLGMICADAMHPLEMQKYLSVLETAQDTAGLAFWDGETQVFPEEIYITARDFNCTPDCDGLPTEVEIYSGGETVELLPGKYIYIVNTKWGDAETSGGRVTHVFAAERLYPHDE